MKKAIIVTGATAGIGYAVAETLLQRGFYVIGIGRNAKSAGEASEKLSAHFADFEYLYGDISRRNDVERLAGELSCIIEQKFDGKLFALINNAGCVKRYYITTPEGFEEQFATNHLAGFLFAHHMMPFLKNAGGRVIFTGSNSHKSMKIRFNDIMLKRKYNPLTAYKQSKLCNMLLALSINQMYNNAKVNAFVVDPGLVSTDIGNKNTGGLVSVVWNFRKKSGEDPKVCAKTYSYLCEDAVKAGLYHYKCAPAKYSKEVNTDNAQKLFELSEKMCNIEFGKAGKS